MRTAILFFAFVLSNPLFADPPAAPAPAAPTSPAPIVAGTGQITPAQTADQIGETIVRIRDQEARLVAEFQAAQAKFQADHAKILQAEAEAMAAFQREQTRIAALGAKLKIPNASNHLRLSVTTYQQEGATNPPTTAKYYVEWTGSDPTGWCRIRNPQTGKITARQIGADGKVNDAPAGFTDIYNGPDGPNELIPMSYPLLMKTAN